MSTACEEPPREGKEVEGKEVPALGPRQLLGAYGDLVKLRLSGIFTEGGKRYRSVERG